MNQFDRQRQMLAISLAALAGYVDAIGFLSADGYFVSFMSGNTTRLAVNLATGASAALTPALLIGGFVVGVIVGALIAIKAGRWRKPAVLTLVAILLANAAALHGLGSPDAALATTVIAMGAINNTFQREGEVAVGLTYMTGALVRLGQAIGAVLAGHGLRAGWQAHALLWSGLAGGAIGGAVIFGHLGPAALWPSAMVATIQAAVAWRLVGQDARPPAPSA